MENKNNSFVFLSFGFVFDEYDYECVCAVWKLRFLATEKHVVCACVERMPLYSKPMKKNDRKKKHDQKKNTLVGRGVGERKRPPLPKSIEKRARAHKWILHFLIDVVALTIACIYVCNECGIHTEYLPANMVQLPNKVISTHYKYCQIVILSVSLSLSVYLSFALKLL